MAVHPTIAAVAHAIANADASDAVNGDTYFNTLAAAALRAGADQLEEIWTEYVDETTSEAAEKFAGWLREICSEEGL